jgi:hypothetical protein
MVRWPSVDRLSRVSAIVLERFKKSSAAKELELDEREWTLVNWAWMPDAPFPFLARTLGEERRYTGDADGCWTMRSFPIVPMHEMP